MKVLPIAYTVLSFDAANLFDELGYSPESSEFLVSPIDELHEFAGRTCYLSHDKPNPDTRENKDYLANILRQRHESVLEHGSVTFYVEGVSRNLLLELERHRFLSFSVLSTRYVPADRMGNIVHPNTPERSREVVENLDHMSRIAGATIYADCIADGYKVKQAREVARQVLPGNTETRFVVSGNIRAWRDIIKKRVDPSADVEIQMFAKEILENLKKITPNSLQDM